MFLDDQIAEDGQFIVNSFGKFFSEVYTKPTSNIKKNKNTQNSPISLCNTGIDILDVFNELYKLNLNLSCGPDNIHPKLLNAKMNAVSFYHI